MERFADSIVALTFEPVTVLTRPVMTMRLAKLSLGGRTTIVNVATLLVTEPATLVMRTL